jgi:TatD DNase family protein
MEQKWFLTVASAIGECGSDKRIEIPLDLQQSVFERQFASGTYNRLAIIHCVLKLFKN